jgi:predicted ferric reductase
VTLWYTARGAGLAALLALTLATTLGALGSRWLASASSRVIMQYLHRSAAVLGLSLLVVHISAVLLDNKAHVGVAGALVPFASSYRPGAVALGSITAYLLLLVSALGAARGRLAASAAATRAWRAIHALGYVAWLTAIWHGFTAGTDSSVGWVRLLYLGCLITVPMALLLRLSALRSAKRSQSTQRSQSTPRPAPALPGAR